MSARIVNLRTVRKQKTRQKQKINASQNAAAKGQSKADKSLLALQNELEARNLDGHKRENDD